MVWSPVGDTRKQTLVQENIAYDELNYAHFRAVCPVLLWNDM
jgi:hypothetical protein